jgi:hypothetical protein
MPRSVLESTKPVSMLEAPMSQSKHIPLANGQVIS